MENLSLKDSGEIIILILLASFTASDDISWSKSLRSKLLFTAVENNNLEKLQELFNLGVRADKFIIVCPKQLDKKHVLIIEILVKKGVIIDENFIRQIFLPHNHEFIPLIIYSIIEKNSKLLKSIFDSLISSQYLGSNILKCMLGAGLLVNGTIKGKTLLELSIINNNSHFVSLLLDRGANFCQKTSDGKFPLFLSVGAEDKSIMEMLLNKGAKVNETTKCGRTALHEACSIVDAEKVKILLEHGADVNLLDCEENTAFTELILYHYELNGDYEFIQRIMVKNLAQQRFKQEKICLKNEEFLEKPGFVENEMFENCLKELSFMKDSRISKSLSLHDIFELRKDPDCLKFLKYVLKYDDFSWSKFKEDFDELKFFADDMEVVVEGIKKIEDVLDTEVTWCTLNVSYNESLV